MTPVIRWKAKASALVAAPMAETGQTHERTLAQDRDTVHVPDSFIPAKISNPAEIHQPAAVFCTRPDEVLHEPSTQCFVRARKCCMTTSGSTAWQGKKALR